MQGLFASVAARVPRDSTSEEVVRSAKSARMGAPAPPGERTDG